MHGLLHDKYWTNADNYTQSTFCRNLVFLQFHLPIMQDSLPVFFGLRITYCPRFLSCKSYFATSEHCLASYVLWSCKTVSLSCKYSQHACKHNILDLARILLQLFWPVHSWLASRTLQHLSIVLQVKFYGFAKQFYFASILNMTVNILGSSKNSLLAIILTCPFLQDRLLSCKMFAVKHLLSKILNLQVVLCKFLHTTCTFLHTTCTFLHTTCTFLHCLASIVFMGS